MVIALLVNRYAPASRGLRKIGATTKNNNAREQQQQQVYLDGLSSNSSSDDHPYQHHEQKLHSSIGIGRHTSVRKKPFRATAFLTSLASDFDVISDWLFLRKSYHNEHVYQIQREEGEASTPSHLIPPLLLWITLFFTILGTIMWLVLATDGRMLMPFTRWLGYDKLSIGHVLFLCVIVEDIPQVILTFLIEDYYKKAALSNLAVVNVTISLYDSMIKLAEAYDERNDIVETGNWCKESLWAHHDVVTSILSLPLPPPRTTTAICAATTTTTEENTNIKLSKSAALDLPSDAEENMISKHSETMATNQMYSCGLIDMDTSKTYEKRSSSVLDDGILGPIAPMKLPRLRFLTTSLDKTIRLWDTAASGGGRSKCIRVFRGHTDGVTAIALLNNESHSSGTTLSDKENGNEKRNHEIYFVTGCEFGDLKLWNLDGFCLRTYPVPTKNSVTGIAVITKSSTLFAASYSDGSVRLWDVWSTSCCLGIYRGHSDVINCICSLQDNTSFATGSKDGTLKLWNTTVAVEKHSQRIIRHNNNNNNNNNNTFQGCDNNNEMGNKNNDPLRLSSSLPYSQPIYEEQICKKTFNSVGEVLCVLYMKTSSSTLLLAGDADGYARIWDIESGSCLKIFEGHYDAVTAVETIDDATILTGSRDRTVKVWDVMSSACLRTYVDHTDFVSSISMTYNNEYIFLTASGDRTVKMWVITSMPSARDNNTNALFRQHSFV